jgi:uncharacterized protein involved in exopolysaccharide biosynthesis
MNNQEFSPYNSVMRVFRYWWVVVALMVAGGVCGFVFHLFLPPVYEAQAYIAINLDYPKRQLTQVEEDHAFNAASGIINSDSVMSLVIADAKEKGYSINPSLFRRDFYLEGRQSVWELHVRDRDPNASAVLTNIWAQEATAALNTALTHALQADQVQAKINSLENCLPGALPQTGSIPLNCQEISQDAIKSMLQEQTAALVNEKNMSFGILSIMTFGLTNLASVPENPVLYGQGGLVLAGALIGLVISIWVVNNLKVSKHD